MTTRTASIGWRWYVWVDNVNGAAKLHVGCVDNDLIVGFDMLVRLVCELGMHLHIRQCDCNGAAVCTLCTAVIVVCLFRYAMSAVCTYTGCFI